MTAEIVSAPHGGKHSTFLSGPPGSGKTSLAVERLRYLLAQGVPAEQILVLVPQRTLATPYFDALSSAEAPAGGPVDVATVGGLARRTIELFWPLAAEPAAFSRPERRPRFLTLETAQYHMDRILESFVAQGAFDGITIPRARLVSQIIDNLNKAAAVGFPPDEIAARLKGAWGGESARLRIYDQVQAAALAFRRSCLEDNLLDWSLQIEVFWQHLLPLPELLRYLLGGYRHLIADNTEEDIPVAHDLLRMWLPQCESALVVHDTGGGYRVFLGADPEGALALRSICRQKTVLTGSHIMTRQVAALGRQLAAPFSPSQKATGPAVPGSTPATSREVADAHEALCRPMNELRFHPQMLDWVAERVARLVHDDGRPPGEVAILAPFLSDSLRFSLSEKLRAIDIPVRSHRPSRPLREEPAARCLLTLARLAHPGWRRSPPTADVAHALAQAIAGMDPVRAHLLTGIVYGSRDGQPELTPFHQIVPEMQGRVSYLLGGRYGELWQWIQNYAGGGEGVDRLDHFLSRLFGELLSQPGFGFHRDFDAGATAANLMESVRKFRQGFILQPTPEGGQGLDLGQDLGLEYVDMVERGVVAAQYVSSWRAHPQDAVLLVPAYTFLMMNRPVSFQFWLDAGSAAWVERIYQPLTHPHILRRDWAEGQVWADEDEVRVRDEALVRLILGLASRCRQRIYLAYSTLNERGHEQQGPILQAVQRLLRAQKRPGS